MPWCTDDEVILLAQTAGSGGMVCFKHMEGNGKPV